MTECCERKAIELVLSWSIQRLMDVMVKNSESWRNIEVVKKNCGARSLALRGPT